MNYKKKESRKKCMAVFFDLYENIIIFGAGNASKKILTLNIIEKCKYFVDNDEKKQSKTFCGKKIFNPNVLLEEDKEKLLIIVASEIFYDDIANQLKTMGFIENYHFVNPFKMPVEFYNSRRDYEFTWKINSEIQPYDWFDRTKTMSTLIPEKCKSILDVGCGKKRLKMLLSPDVQYYSMDREKAMNPDYIYDWNEDDFPNIKNVDYAFASGALEYIDDLENFIFKISPYIDKGFICSYNPHEFFVNLTRFRNPLWRNCYRVAELIIIFQKNGFNLYECVYDDIDNSNGEQVILCFKK